VLNQYELDYDNNVPDIDASFRFALFSYVARAVGELRSPEVSNNTGETWRLLDGKGSSLR
jgi:hypothetical protein